MCVATDTNFNMIIFHTVEKVGERSVKCNSFYFNFHQHPLPSLYLRTFNHISLITPWAPPPY